MPWGEYMKFISRDYFVVIIDAIGVKMYAITDHIIARMLSIVCSVYVLYLIISTILGD